jgi:hypothetical protein
MGELSTVWAQCIGFFFHRNQAVRSKLTDTLPGWQASSASFAVSFDGQSWLHTGFYPVQFPVKLISDNKK